MLKTQYNWSRLNKESGRCISKFPYSFSLKKQQQRNMKWEQCSLKKNQIKLVQCNLDCNPGNTSRVLENWLKLNRRLTSFRHSWISQKKFLFSQALIKRWKKSRNSYLGNNNKNWFVITLSCFSYIRRFCYIRNLRKK